MGIAKFFSRTTLYFDIWQNINLIIAQYLSFWQLNWDTVNPATPQLYGVPLSDSIVIRCYSNSIRIHRSASLCLINTLSRHPSRQLVQSTFFEIWSSGQMHGPHSQTNAGGRDALMAGMEWSPIESCPWPCRGFENSGIGGKRVFDDAHKLRLSNTISCLRTPLIEMRINFLSMEKRSQFQISMSKASVNIFEISPIHSDRWFSQSDAWAVHEWFVLCCADSGLGCI